MELNRNLPGSKKWEGSFYEQTTEYGIWNSEAFERLLLNLSELGSAGTTEIETAKKLLILQAKILNLVAAHFNKQDVFYIENMDTEKLLEHVERLETSIIGAITYQ